jgi:hypothetical protein
MNSKTKAMLASWGRSFVAASVALYSTGETDPALLLNAGIAAVIPVLVRFLNKKDPAFGRVAELALNAATKEVAKKSRKKASPKKDK